MDKLRVGRRLRLPLGIHYVGLRHAEAHPKMSAHFYREMPSLATGLAELRSPPMRSMVLAVAFFLAFLLQPHTPKALRWLHPQISVFHFTEKPGPDAVGLKVVEQYDFSRSYRSVTDELGKPYQGERARPRRCLIWYPAQKSNGKPMTVGDYGRLAGYWKPALGDLNFAGLEQWIDGHEAYAEGFRCGRYGNAPLLAGKFPVGDAMRRASLDVLGERRLVRVPGEPRLGGGGGARHGRDVAGYDSNDFVGIVRRRRTSSFSDWVRADAAGYGDVGDCGGRV